MLYSKITKKLLISSTFSDKRIEPKTSLSKLVIELIPINPKYKHSIEVTPETNYKLVD